MLLWRKYSLHILFSLFHWWMINWLIEWCSGILLFNHYADGTFGQKDLVVPIVISSIQIHCEIWRFSIKSISGTANLIPVFTYVGLLTLTWKMRQHTDMATHTVACTAQHVPTCSHPTASTVSTLCKFFGVSYWCWRYPMASQFDAPRVALFEVVGMVLAACWISRHNNNHECLVTVMETSLTLIQLSLTSKTTGSWLGTKT